MTRDLNVMDKIMKERDKEIVRNDLPPLDPEGKKMAEYKRVTIDMVGVPVDPLR